MQNIHQDKYVVAAVILVCHVILADTAPLGQKRQGKRVAETDCTT